MAVVVIRSLHAERRSRLRGRRPTAVEPGATAPDAVPITRAIVIAAQALEDERAAAGWLRDTCGGRDTAAIEVEHALDQVNAAVAAHRIAAHDPRVRDLAVTDVQRVRLGYGTGDEVVGGQWREAYAIPPERAKRKSRRRMLSPQEEMAGMLSGRRPPGRPSEELILRARLDVEHGRPVEAALVTRAATEALAAEGLAGADPETADRLARAALAGDLSPADEEELEALITTLERAVRRRRYASEG